MRKYLLIFLCFLVLLSSLLFILQKRSISYFYVNPYTETSSFNHISCAISKLNKILSLTKLTVENDGYAIKYLYQNPYGSGFLKNNPIPNDLDFAVGVDLGTFEYNGTNSLDIAIQIMNIIKSFYYNLAINLQLNEQGLYLSSTPMSVLSRLNKFEQTNINDIVSALNYVIKEENYVKFTSFDNIIGIAEDVVRMPYTMNSNEILLQELQPLIIYSDNVTYNAKMKKFMREISLVPEFSIKLKYKGKYYDVELVPEAFKGTRLQLSRRCFASTVFTGFNSYRFLRDVNWLENDADYIKYRMLSYKRHVQEVDRLISAKKSPVKVLKRIMQIADLVQPLLPENEYDKIVNFVSDNLNNKDIQLLNDYLTIYSNVANIYRFNTLKTNLLRAKKLHKMLELSEDILLELKQRGNIPNSLIVKMNNLNKGFADNISKKQQNLSVVDFLVNFDNLELELNAQIFKLITDQNIIEEFLALNDKILNQSGYREVLLYWLSDSKIGIISDSFTKTIKDLHKFAILNGLPDIQYALITTNQLPKYPLKFKLYVHDGRESNELRNKFLQDKKNFDIKFKMNFI